MIKRIAFVVLTGLAVIVGLVMAAPTATAQTTATCAQDVRVQSGDSLSKIAFETLGSFGAYSRIVDATNAAADVDSSYATITNAGRITVGWKLCIPGDGPVVDPNATPRPTATPTVTPTPTPTIDPDAPNPLEIEVMREQEYPGSDIVIEQTLAPGANYQRYYVSYLSEGNKIYALLTVPNGVVPETGWPVVIFNHGYIAPEVYRTTERYIAYVDGFARNGYIVLRSDYRGHASSEGEATGGYGSPAYTVDVLNAVASVKKYPAADPDRMGMWGHSMGGQITLRSMVVTDDIKAGVIWAGVVGSYPDILYNWRRSPAYTFVPPRTQRPWRDEYIEAYGTPEENPEFWASISPNTYVADLSGPIQLHHGTNDGSVPFEFSVWLDEQIQAVGGVSEIYMYEGDDHNLAGYFNTAMSRSIAFFDKYVKNAE